MRALIVDESFILNRMLDRVTPEMAENFRLALPVSLTYLIYELITSDDETFDFTDADRSVAQTTYARLLSLQAIVATTAYIEDMADPVGAPEMDAFNDAMCRFVYSLFLEYLTGEIRKRLTCITEFVLRFELSPTTNKLVVYL